MRLLTAEAWCIAFFQVASLRSVSGAFTPLSVPWTARTTSFRPPLIERQEAAFQPKKDMPSLIWKMESESDQPQSLFQFHHCRSHQRRKPGGCSEFRLPPHSNQHVSPAKPAAGFGLLLKENVCMLAEPWRFFWTDVFGERLISKLEKLYADSCFRLNRQHHSTGVWHEHPLQLYGSTPRVKVVPPKSRGLHLDPAR